MSILLFAFLFAIFIWWFSTTVLLAMTRKNSNKRNLWIMVLSTVCLVFGYMGIIFSSENISVPSAYIAFFSSILIWFWLESTFLVGWATGVRKSPCPDEATGLRRAWLAFQVINYHEFLILAVATSTYLLTQNSENFVGLYSFMILWIMKISSKINIFLGVRNLSENFLPEKISYVKTYFRKRSFNFFFPIFVGIAIVIDMLFWDNAFNATTSYLKVSYSLLASLLALGILEHILMIVPFQLNKLWSLGLSEQK